MSERTCTVEGCDGIRHGRRYCSMHYQRVRHHGHIGPARPPKPTQCAVDGCTEPHDTRDWCGKHYQRWLKHGDPMAGRASTQARGTPCSVEGCDRPLVARGYCKLHYRRWQAHGDAQALPEPSYWLDLPEGTKRCRKCEQVKPQDDFYRWKRYADGRASWCKVCWLAYRAEWHVNRSDEIRERRRLYEQRQKARRSFGLTADEYDALWADPTCRVCAAPHAQAGRRLHIDHDHTTGKVRGLLCHHCNLSIGLARESADRLRALAAYLEAHAT